MQAKTAGLAPRGGAVNGLHRAARRQGSFLIGCRRVSGAPGAATRSQGRRGKKTGEEKGGRFIRRLAARTSSARTGRDLEKRAAATEEHS